MGSISQALPNYTQLPRRRNAIEVKIHSLFKTWRRLSERHCDCQRPETAPPRGCWPKCCAAWHGHNKVHSWPKGTEGLRELDIFGQCKALQSPNSLLSLDLWFIRHLFTRRGADAPVCNGSFYYSYFFHNNLLPWRRPVTDPATAFKQWCSSFFLAWKAPFTQLWFTGDRQAKKTATLWQRLKKLSHELLQIVAENCELIDAFL